MIVDFLLLCLQTFAIRFKTAELAQDFEKAFRSGQDDMKALLAGADDSSSSNSNEAEQAAEALNSLTVAASEDTTATTTTTAAASEPAENATSDK